MTEKLQLRDAVYRLEDTIREIPQPIVDDQGRVDEIAFGKSKADPLFALAVAKEQLVLLPARAERNVASGRGVIVREEDEAASN